MKFFGLQARFPAFHAPHLPLHFRSTYPGLSAVTGEEEEVLGSSKSQSKCGSAFATVPSYVEDSIVMTRSQFEEALEALRSRITEMANYADRMIANAMQSLMDVDVSLAEFVIETDDEMDDLDINIEVECMKLLALQQPIARDLRLIGTSLKVVTDLERIGDHAVDIAKVTRKLESQKHSQILVDLPKMANCVRQMLKDALNAFVKHDLTLVDRVIAADDEVDELFHELRSELHEQMKGNADLVVSASYQLFVSHYLERMADHAVNIAERVGYIETGNLTQYAKHYP